MTTISSKGTLWWWVLQLNYMLHWAIQAYWCESQLEHLYTGLGWQLFSEPIIKSQNHRLVDARKDLWRSFRPTPRAKAGPSGAGCMGPCPDDFWISPRMETPQSLSVRPVPMFSQKCKVLVTGSEKWYLEMSGVHRYSSTICVMGHLNWWTKYNLLGWTCIM